MNPYQAERALRGYGPGAKSYLAEQMQAEQDYQQMLEDEREQRREERAQRREEEEDEESELEQLKARHEALKKLCRDAVGAFDRATIFNGNSAPFCELKDWLAREEEG